MTPRAILLGLLGTAFVCGSSYINDRILQQTYLVGNNMPVFVYGGLILFAVCINPLFKRKALTGREIAVILTLTLATCCIPGSGFLRTFTNSLVLPHHYNRIEPGWKEKGVIDLAPKQMLADVTQNEDEVLNGFLQGMGSTGNHISLGDIPWYGWVKTFAFWIPVVLTLWLALMALALVFHRQWSEHEHLPYPVAEFANSLLPNVGKATMPLARNRLFWIGAGLVFAIHLNNCLCQWFPQYLIPVPVRFNLTALARLFPVFVRGGGARLLAPVAYFSVIGLTYFLPSDVAFSVGIGPFLWAIVAGIFTMYGVSLNGAVEGGGYMGLKIKTFMLFGSNLGLFFAILYLGRHYYLSALKRAVGMKSSEPVEQSAVTALRVALVLLVLFVVQLVLAGLDWQLAVLYTCILVMFFIMISRVMAETGLFYIQPYYFPCVILWGACGAGALGLKQLLIMLLLCGVLVVDPRESIMPFMSTSLKLLDLREASLSKATKLSVIAVAFGLLVALPLTIYFQYDRGCALSDGWASSSVPKMPFENIVSVEQRLSVQGKLEQAESLSGWARFGALSPNGPCMVGMVAGLVLVLAFAGARLRFNWWPLHPILFVVWATEPQWRLCGAFLMGWFLKAMVTKYGGARTYQRLKPLMFGLIAGEVLGALFPSLIGAIYFICTGDVPPRFWVLPG
ncbi:MAG: hypothetical protein HN742_29730 [Lentisphaerae bacterium]|jgi:hypothetical protein|nr:hypothetical protein [Lentisphaerota bacterium]MBT4823013.1 hypothetical protein [Lentisphaerota bacterium]MBT5612772.1 hypothetical protein [Lentisphaerota bacterium]MBT7053988.1 hypothetical protein [Lentisphaerota bacterium]MBT7846089.1 hypothetical protein [Lentisphaerota bacterium]